MPAYKSLVEVLSTRESFETVSKHLIDTLVALVPPVTERNSERKLCSDRFIAEIVDEDLINRIPLLQAIAIGGEAKIVRAEITTYVDIPLSINCKPRKYTVEDGKIHVLTNVEVRVKVDAKVWIKLPVDVYSLIHRLGSVELWKLIDKDVLIDPAIDLLPEPLYVPVRLRAHSSIQGGAWIVEIT